MVNMTINEFNKKYENLNYDFTRIYKIELSENDSVLDSIKGYEKSINCLEKIINFEKQVLNDLKQIKGDK